MASVPSYSTTHCSSSVFAHSGDVNFLLQAINIAWRARLKDRRFEEDKSRKRKGKTATTKHYNISINLTWYYWFDPDKVWEKVAMD